MDAIGDLGDAKKVTAIEQDFVTGLQTRVVPALAQAIRDAGAGLTVDIHTTITFSKKEQS